MPHDRSRNSQMTPTTHKDSFVDISTSETEASGKERMPSLTPWRPISLRASYLVSLSIVSLGLAALLQTLLCSSQKRQGLLFASHIAELGLWSTFLYLYLPTITAVLYSLAWSWVDQDTRRFEPWRQMSRPEGASAEDSILLHYASDFLPIVPLKALRRRHWVVFVASSALVLVSWGITPLQAAIFATDTVMVNLDETMQTSNKYLNTSEQARQVTANYTYSVFDIMWHNERLPPYMSREAAVAPLQPSTNMSDQSAEYWTAHSTLFSLDMHCEPAILQLEKSKDFSDGTFIGYSSQLYYTSSQGCKIPSPYGPDGNETVGGTGLSQVKEFTAFYAAYQNHDGLADYYISQYCPANASNVFLAAFAQNKKQSNDTPVPATTLFCSPNYFQQNVSATVRRRDLLLTNVTAWGTKQPLPSNLFDPSRLEWQMSSAIQQQAVRGLIPSTRWPDQTRQLSNLPLSLLFQGTKLPIMAGMAIGATQRPLHEYLDPEVLAQSYEAAYQLQFARAMVDVLQNDFTGFLETNGTRSYTIETVYMVGGFTYAVEALLVASALLALSLLLLGLRDRVLLGFDPGSVAALMTLSAKDTTLLRTVLQLDMHDHTGSTERLANQRYRLEYSDSSCVLRQIDVDITSNPGFAVNRPKPGKGRLHGPREISIYAGAAFFSILLAILIGLTYLYIKARGQPSGIALPSNSRFVRQMVENYLPTILATLIEPVWVMLNRLMCTLQPFEVMRAGAATASKSIELNYTAVPPQLAIFQAVWNRHLRLSIVSLMALLANVLAIAAGAMFNEATLSVAVPVNFTQPYAPMFEAIDGTIGPWNNTFSGGQSLDQFYVAMSNLTTGTLMPSWTNNSSFFMPFGLPSQSDNATTYCGITRSFSAGLECSQLKQGSADSWSVAIQPDSYSDVSVANVSVQTSYDGLGSLHCIIENFIISTQFQNDECPRGDAALELVLPMHPSQNASIAEQEACRQLIFGGWFRRPNGVCMSLSDGSLAPSNSTIHLTDVGSTVLACSPKLQSQFVSTTVDQNGIIVSSNPIAPVELDLQKYFTADSGQLTLQANNYLIGNGLDPGPGRGVAWHNDSFPSDWNNYIMDLIAVNNSVLDPNLAPPEYTYLQTLLNAMYGQLFAIWLGINHADFLEPALASAAPVTGVMLQNETRVIVSRTMFYVAAAILGTYLSAIVAVYCHRPGRHLPYLPTSIASVTALFAASRAVKDFQDFADMSEKRRKAVFKEGNIRYGYGLFMGTDRRFHNGIECEPLIRRERNLPHVSTSKRIFGSTSMWKRF